MWHRIWHSSIKNRLTFLFFCITAGAILVFYFYVVPQLESTLTQQKTDALERDASAYSRSLQGAIAREVTAAELDRITRAISEETGTRVTLLGHPARRAPAAASAPCRRRSSPPYVISDSRRGRHGRGAVERDRPRGRAHGERADHHPRRGRRRSSRRWRGRCSTRAGRPGWSSSREPLDDVEENVVADPAPDPDRGAARAAARDRHRLLRGERARAPREAPRARRARGRGRQLLRARSRSTPTTSWASSRAPSTRCSTGSRASTRRARSSSRTPRTSCARRSSRWAGSSSCSRTRTSTRTPAPSSSPRCASRWTVCRSSPPTCSTCRGSTPARSTWSWSRCRCARSRTRWRASSRPRRRARTPRSRSPTASPQLDIEAVCDPERVAQIVRVLIDNALVHTPDGTRITIAARRGPRAGRPRHRPAAGHRRRPRHPPPRPGDRLRALPHERLGSGLGPRPRDRARAGPAHARRPRGHLEAGQHDLHAHAPARGRARAARRGRPPRATSRRAPRWAHDAPGRHRRCWRRSR